MIVQFKKPDPDFPSYYGMNFPSHLLLVLSEFFYPKHAGYRHPELLVEGSRMFPHNYEPVIVAKTPFDPYLIGFYDVKIFKYEKETMWKYWPDCNRLDKFEQFLDLMKSTLYKDCKKSFKNIFPEVRRYESLAINHFIYSKKMLSHKVAVLGFYHLRTRTYRQYLIKDIYKLFRILWSRRSDKCKFDIIRGMVKKLDDRAPVLCEYSKLLIEKYNFSNEFELKKFNQV